MSGLLYLLGLGLVFGGVAIGAYTLTPGRAFIMSVRRSPQIAGAGAKSIGSPWFRVVYPLLDVMAPLYRRIRLPSYRVKKSTDLLRAGLGQAITVDHLLAMKTLAAVVVPWIAQFLFAVLKNPALFLAVGVAGFYLPDRIVADLRKAREGKILRSLPTAVDVLSLSVEAGLEFLAALQRLVERGRPGPLRDEIATILNDIRLGESRAGALKSFGQRVAIPEVTSFVSVLVQADLLGASIGPVLRSQAERMRVERFQRAEKEGARVSQKILFPLVVFIFPAVLVVIIGPVALQFIYGLK